MVVGARHRGHIGVIAQIKNGAYLGQLDSLRCVQYTSLPAKYRFLSKQPRTRFAKSFVAYSKTGVSFVITASVHAIRHRIFE